MTKESKVERTSTPEEQAERMEAWKYNALKRAILDALQTTDGAVAAPRLVEMVEERLSSDELIDIGDVEDYAMFVWNDLEENGEIERVGKEQQPRWQLA